MTLEVTSAHVAKLADDDLRTLVAHLCECELRSRGQSPAAVTWGGHQNAPDGGLDVRVQASTSLGSSYVPRPLAGFQVKAQRMASKAIAKEMAPNGNLRPVIAALVSSAGAYIIVSSKDSVSDKELAARRAAMLRALGSLPPDSDAVLDFYDNRRIASWVNQHRPQVAWVHARLGDATSSWRPFGDWSSSPTGVDAPFLLDDHSRLVGPTITDPKGLTAEQAVLALRELLQRPKGTVRLAGLSGVGKTRLVQALFDERLGSNPLSAQAALYADVSDDPRPTPLEMLSRLIEDRERVVLIVDNCGLQLHHKLAEALANSNSTSSLITVEYDINDDEPSHTTSFKLQPASSALIEKLLERRYSSIASPSRRVIAEFSEGNARVAFALAETAKNGQSLLKLSDTELFRRLFDQRKGPSSALLDAAKVCALLYSFNGDPTDVGASSELAVLAALIEQSDKQLHKHTAELYRRQLIQKRDKWRAILPHALANRLARLALEDIPLDHVERALVQDASDRVARSFSRRIGFLHDHAGAKAIGQRWLRPGGRLTHLGSLSGHESQVFENIAPVCPASTLDLVAYVAERDPDFFVENANQLEIVKVLRSLAYDPDLFERSVSLIRRFAEHELGRQKEASDILKSLFWICLSGTHASAAQRADLISKLLVDAAEVIQTLGATLLREMLKTTHFSSHYSFEFGGWKRDYGFYPQTNEQHRDWYAQALAAARRAFAAGPDSVKQDMRKILATNTVSLLRAGLHDVTIDALEALASASEWSEGWIATKTALRKGKEKLPEPVARRLASLEQRLRPTDLGGMVRSYALSPEWTTLDVADADEGADLKPLEARERVNAVCVGLGRQLAGHSAQLGALLVEIIRSPSTKTAALGAGIASACESIGACWSDLTAAFFAVPENERRSYLLEGFMSAAVERCQSDSEELLDGVLRDERLHCHFIDLQASAGIKGRAGERILTALRLESIPVDSYLRLSGGRAHEGLDDQQMGVLLRALSQRPQGKVIGAQILGMRVFGCLSDKVEITASLSATCREFLREFEPQRGDHLDHLIGMIVTTAYREPEHEAEARDYCARVLASVERYQVYAWDVDDGITALAKAFPVAVLDVFVEQALASGGVGSLLFDELREGRPCALDQIPIELWTAWAKQDLSKRSQLLAQVIRFAEFPESAPAGWSHAALTLMDMSPEPQSILDIFYGRFGPRSWTGSRAIAMAKRQPLIDTLKAHHKEAIRQWADRHAERFAAAVAVEQARELTESRTRDQAFE
jgi:hypothetical protein